MKPPNLTPPPGIQPHLPQQQLPSISTSANEITTSPAPSSPINSQPFTVKPQTVVTTQIQQTPLALTTQAHISATAQGSAQFQQTPMPPANLQTQLPQIHSKVHSPQPLTTLTNNPQPLSLASTPTSTGSTLVIIPQHSSLTTTAATTTSANSTKTATISTIATTITPNVGVTPAHVTLTATAQPVPIQLQSTVTTNVPSITPVPLAAHQQSTTNPVLTQPTLASRSTSTLTIVPITTTTPVNIKPEPDNKFICCLLDNGIRCDRVAGNASFSARIQKIVGTKKMNYTLDPTVRHAYICEHHKAIITVAKKSTALTRDGKSNARSYGANNANTLPSQANSNFNDMSGRPNLQHSVNLELINNQNRLNNNHVVSMNNMPVRPGAQLAYTQYQGPRASQVGSMDMMMQGSFDNTGGDRVASSSSGIDVDLQQLQVNTLRRYKRHFRVQTRPGLNKMQLAESLKSHFRTLPIIEKEAITYFVYIVKCYRNKLDHNPKAD